MNSLSSSVSIVSQSFSSWFDLRIAAKRSVASDIHAFELIVPDGGLLPPFTAGAHLDVLCGDVVRQYSLCGAPHDRSRYTIAVQHERSGRGGSAYLCTRLQAGATLQVRGPINHFPLHEHAAPALLVAGGIGITPLLAMAQELHAAGRAFELHYLARGADKVVLPALGGTAPWLQRCRVQVTGGGSRADVGELLGGDHDGRHLYVCGPASLIDAVLGAARGAGWPADRLHAEYFAAAGAAPADASAERAFTVEVASTGARVVVGTDESVVAALARIGVNVSTSCGQGVCGSCLTRIVSGTPDHRDYLLTQAEQAAGQSFTPCCSRALSDLLVLDL